MITTSSCRSSGIRSKILFTRSALGSMTRVLRPARISAKMRCSSTVDFPQPVGPIRIQCCKLAWGLIDKRWLPLGTMLLAKLRSYNRLVGSRYHAGGRVSFGCRPLVPGSSSSPKGSSIKLVSSFTDRRSGKCHGTFALIKCCGLSGSVCIRVPTDSSVRSALRIVLIRLCARSPDTPMRICTSKQCCSFFSRIDFLVSTDASSTPNMMALSHDTWGSGMCLGVGCGRKDFPSTICMTDSSSPRTAASAASPARMVDEIASVLRDRPVWEITSCRAALTGARWYSSSG